MSALFLILLVVSTSALRIPYLSPVLENVPLIGKYFRPVSLADNKRSVTEALGNLGKYLQDMREGIHTDVQLIVQRMRKINSHGKDINFMVNGINSGILSPTMIKDMIKGMSFPLCDLVEEIIYPIMKARKGLDGQPEKVQGAAKSIISIVTAESFGLLEREHQVSTVNKLVEQLTGNEMKALKKILDELIADIKEAESSGPSEPEESAFESEDPIPINEKATVTPDKEKIEL